MIDPAEKGPEEGRSLPPAGNGSLAGHDEIPVAVPSAMFIADRDAEHKESGRQAGPAAAENVEEFARRESAIVEAGPFSGLADLDAFERRLVSLPGVAALRLRNFAEGRAAFEVELAGTGTPLQRQLREQLPDALVGLTPTGLRIDLEAGS